MQSNDPQVTKPGGSLERAERRSPRRAREALSKLERPQFAFRDPAYGCVDWFEYEEAEVVADRGRRTEPQQRS